MKLKNILLVGAIVIVIGIVFFTLDGGSQEEYNKQILKEREEKDHFMKNSSESPFVAQKQNYDGLKFFPPDERYRVIANLRPVENKKLRTLPTSDGKEETYAEYAYAEFDLGNRRHSLLILEVMEMGPRRGTLFLAFGDETSANETYGAGRYLDVKKVPGSATMTLDFNKAYNPYCAYSDRYSCPLPPAENLLQVPIRAGEKIYHE